MRVHTCDTRDHPFLPAPHHQQHQVVMEHITTQDAVSNAIQYNA